MKSTHRGVLLLVKVHFRQMSFMEFFTKLLLIPFKTTVTLEFLSRSSLYSIFIYCFIYSLFTLYKHTFIQTFRGFHYIIFWTRLSAQLSTVYGYSSMYLDSFYIYFMPFWILNTSLLTQWDIARLGNYVTFHCYIKSSTGVPIWWNVHW